MSHPEVIFVDVEASSLDRGYPIEVGWAIVRDFEVTTESALIRPTNAWYFDDTRWSPESEAVHKITPGTLLDHGRPVAEVKARMTKLFVGKTLYSDAARLDFSWIVELFHADAPAGPSVPFRLNDLSELYAGLDTDEMKFEQEMRKRKKYRPEHRAADDALNHALMWCFTRRGIGASKFELPKLRESWNFLLS